MQAVLAMGTQMKSLTEAVTDLNDKNTQQTSVIFELRSYVQQLAQELKKRHATTTPTPQPQHKETQATPTPEVKQTTPTDKGRGKSYATATACGPPPHKDAFTEVTNK